MKNDRLDALLTELPSEAPPADLAQRICQEIYLRNLRRHRHVGRVKLALSGLLGLVGAWLAFPMLSGTAQRLVLPASGVSILVNWYEMAQLGLLSWLEVVIKSLVSFQGGLAASPGTMAWMGLISLALGSLLVLDQFLLRVSTN